MTILGLPITLHSITLPTLGVPPASSAILKQNDNHFDLSGRHQSAEWPMS